MPNSETTASRPHPSLTPDVTAALRTLPNLSPETLAFLDEADAINVAVDRPEIIAEDSDPCTDCDGTGRTIQTERWCSCAEGIRLRAAEIGDCYE